MTPELTLAASNLLSALQLPGVHIEATPDYERIVQRALEAMQKALEDATRCLK